MILSRIRETGKFHTTENRYKLVVSFPPCLDRNIADMMDRLLCLAMNYRLNWASKNTFW